MFGIIDPLEMKFFRLTIRLCGHSYELSFKLATNRPNSKLKFESNGWFEIAQEIA